MWKASQDTPTGVQINVEAADMFPSPIATALFSLVWAQVLAIHDCVMEVPPQVPMMNTKAAKYRTDGFSVAAARANPTAASVLSDERCHVRSLKCPDERDTPIAVRQATR